MHHNQHIVTLVFVICEVVQVYPTSLYLSSKSSWSPFMVRGLRFPAIPPGRVVPGTTGHMWTDWSTIITTAAVKDHCGHNGFPTGS